jgi:hypothetical protein
MVEIQVKEMPNRPARPGAAGFRARPVMNHRGASFPAPRHAPPAPKTIFIDAGEVGGIGNALNRARSLFPPAS